MVIKTISAVLNFDLGQFQASKMANINQSKNSEPMKRSKKQFLGSLKSHQFHVKCGAGKFSFFHTVVCKNVPT